MVIGYWGLEINKEILIPFSKYNEPFPEGIF